MLITSFNISHYIKDRIRDRNVCVLNRVWLFATPWTVTCQAPLSMGFSTQEHWSGLLFPSPRDRNGRLQFLDLHFVCRITPDTATTLPNGSFFQPDRLWDIDSFSMPFPPFMPFPAPQWTGQLLASHTVTNTFQQCSNPGNQDSHFIASLLVCYYGCFYCPRLFIQKVSFWKYKPKDEKAIEEKIECILPWNKFNKLFISEYYHSPKCISLDAPPGNKDVV